MGYKCAGVSSGRVNITRGTEAKEAISMTKLELEVLLKEFDAALVEAFPGPEPMSALLVGGACLLLQGITTQLTGSVEVIILELLGSQERTLVFHSPTADKVRRIIRKVGKRHGLKGGYCPTRWWIIRTSLPLA